MSGRTLAELCYMIASVVVTLLITWYAAWGYPQGGTEIWVIGIVSAVLVAIMALRPFLDSWRVDRARMSGRRHG
ncbi:MAG: hypothetical protein J0I47_01840 [Sphingomonas sp.]|uniref:hypothetical protein n=1 Tax=Sphingomonas sp. TaxID=28214 RepID=UPI001ACD9344|nr:hypothetical protein [Sphingomonas sp.]MBN8806970.1 hypothetical protein [Sphingomonas sp.]